MSEPNNPDIPEGGKDNERTVTDPITHLPLTIHDATSVELEQIPPPPSTAEHKQQREERGADTEEDTNRRHADMEDVIHESVNGNWWEDPVGDQRRTRVQTAIVAAGAATVGALGAIIMWSFVGTVSGKAAGLGWVGVLLAPLACCLLGLGVGASALSFSLFQREPEHRPVHNRKDTQKPKTLNKDHTAPESAAWLNSLLNSLWPIVNPSLFTAVSDMLEDAMQATLPKMVHGVRVADVGQGTESIRVLGIRWLDPGSAAKDIDGMKAEEGDFFNLEVALAYRAKGTTAQGMKGRSANAHLLMEFWVAGGMVIPVWVELTGLLTTVRMRFQLTPNPPFLSLMTLTLLGLPKVSLKCTPLAKNFLNVMDVPGLSTWLQKSINIAVTEYVAPRSLTLDLRTLLMGRPKMDTDAVGVMIVTIRRARGFRSGDASKLLKTSEGKKGDPYVSIGWSKLGKPLWSTRIIKGGEPTWEETTALLVGPAELNGQESLRLQLWDSDRFTADDLLGNVEVPLQELVSGSHNKISTREDGLVAQSGDTAPGTISWEVGYFVKTTLSQHLEHKHRDAEALKEKIESEAEAKLREAKARDDEAEDGEVEQQKKEDLKDKTDEVISGSKPTTQWRSGILSIRVEQISGLEIEKIRESGVKADAEDDEADDLPSAYCTIIINQQRVYKTRTKMKSNNPYYDAGTEKFIRDWTTTDVMISVRDSRIHEADPVIGIIVLPLRDLFKHQSIFMDSLPLVGGIGYGRMKLSLIFRSVQLKLPKRLLGWDVGTLEIHPHATASNDLPAEYASCRLKFRTLHGKGKMAPSQEGGWSTRQGRPVRLAVQKRYTACLLITLRKRAVGPDVTPAFCTLWLKDIPDDEEVRLSLPIRRNEDGAVAQARANATEDIGEHVGTLDLSVRLWPGLSGYHKYLADHDANMADVMEVLDYAEGSQDTSKNLLADDDYSGSDTSDSEDEYDEEGHHEEKHDEASEHSTQDGNLAKENGVVGDFKDFRKRKGELHRKHRGLMQWKAMRNVAWIGRGVENTAGKLGGKVMGTFKHHDREPKVEKEV
ncbi:hypothetical protein B0H34DRAFT_791097 [Crassisporium funariophilum]|nr:hypothetical protein B0H34DRAFT_791097 [Crassisporium funariophilum]